MLKEKLHELVSACFTGIWIETHETHEAAAEIRQLCQEQDWQLATWDIDRGLVVGTGENLLEANDPLAAIKAVNAMATNDGAAVLVMNNLHKFISSTEVLQALQHQLLSGKQDRTIVIGLSPTAQIPNELEKLFVVIEHALPNREQLEEIVRSIATEEGEFPDGAKLETVLDAAAGLTRLEAENAFSLSLVRQGRIEPDAIWELKAGMLKKSGLMQLYHGEEDFNSLGGLENLKAFTKRCLLQPNRDKPLRRPRGVLLLGVPGTGKSAFAKSLGKETDRPTLVLDIGALMGSLVGQTEANIRRALQIADAMAPCILFVDELEKALSGAAGSGQSDSGVSSRLFGTLLSWMNDHTSNVYLVATCNDISKIPPELTRAERFDGIVFLDLPSREEKGAIWQQYISTFELDRDQSLPNDKGWTGAEVRACCRLSALLDVPLKQAATNVVPVSATAGESVERLRTWANGRCLDAEKGGIYQYRKSSSSRRKVRRDPSLN
ncbi:ATP-dependent zinc metalloprotease FtsH 4 [Mariniblastus fucicola]|uniref:Uncharacterized AAA domain-containing protein ycf46 n=2 Tax=Mariniblastus fucicola TaxID=980251 RepID=A0A5B9PC04_9BACT|nr:ATP-dependent zinc metalloprotease FtsH 4 [Mariniblastus fucicola]